MFIVLIGTSFWRFDFFAFGYTRAAKRSISAMARSIKQHDHGGGLLIYDGPVLLYPMTGHRPMSPLALPLHLNYEVEDNVSHLNTEEEVARILARKPGVVLMSLVPRNEPANLATLAMVVHYVETKCQLVDVEWSSEMFRSDRIAVYGDCSNGSNRHKRIWAKPKPH